MECSKLEGFAHCCVCHIAAALELQADCCMPVQKLVVSYSMRRVDRVLQERPLVLSDNFREGLLDKQVPNVLLLLEQPEDTD